MAASNKGEDTQGSRGEVGGTMQSELEGFDGRMGIYAWYTVVALFCRDSTYCPSNG